jgi:glycosyltransferase involved in cell wall biosynthesis
VRVVHVGLETTSTRSGGLNRYFEDLVAAERRIGVDAVGVALSSSEATVDWLGVAGAPSQSLPRRLLGIDRAVRRAGRVDLADLHFAGTAAFTAVLGALRGVPKVAHFQGPWAEESAVGGAGRVNVAVKRAVERRVYRRVDRFVVLSAAFGELLQRRYGVAPWSIDVLAPGVDLDRFAPGDRAAARRELGVDARRVVLSVRRLVPRMGIEHLLGAWARLAPSDGDLLAIVGDGPEAAPLAALAASLGVDATVRFCGRVDDADLVRWYRAADVTVVPSVALEGFGLVVLESAACGTPVVATDAGGLDEALATVGCGPAVAVGDETALAEALSVALADGRPEGPGALRDAAASHGWDAVAARHATIYADVLAGRHPRRVVVLDHTAVLSGGELALARALGGLPQGAATVHAILAVDGPFRGRLEGSGVSVEVLAMDEGLRTTRREAIRPGALAPRGLLDSARYVARLAARLRRLRPDVVHTNSLKSALYGGAAARLAGVPCVWHLRDRIDEDYLPRFAVRVVRVAA